MEDVVYNKVSLFSFYFTSDSDAAGTPKKSKRSMWEVIVTNCQTEHILQGDLLGNLRDSWMLIQ